MAAGKFTGWHKASRSKDSNECVEIGYTPRSVGVRDTKQNRRGPVLEFSDAAWMAFLHQVKTGSHDMG